jgi:methionyl-tRNA formyltransferase
VVFVGAVHEAWPALAALLHSDLVEPVIVVTTTEQASGALSGAVDLGQLAHEAGVPVLRIDNINASGVVDTVQQLAPDLVVVVGWTRLIGPALLSIPRCGTVGFHASMLPHNRGRAPVNWAILRGEQTAGNTMMMLDPGVDTGDIVDQRGLAISPEDTCGSLYERVAAVGAEMLIGHLPALLDGTAPRRPQPATTSAPLPKRTPDMGVLDWDRSARAVHDWIRALTAPYPGAFSSVSGRRVMVWRSRTPMPAISGPPGLILACETDGVRVATRGGSVLVTEMSAPGEPAQAARPWCERAGLGPGVRFDAVPSAVASWAQGLGPQPAEISTS